MVAHIFNYGENPGSTIDAPRGLYMNNLTIRMEQEFDQTIRD